MLTYTQMQPASVYRKKTLLGPAISNTASKIGANQGFESKHIAKLHLIQQISDPEGLQVF